MKKKVIISFLLIATLFLTSCSSHSQDNTITTSETTPETSTEVTDVVNKEFRYENLPTEWDLTELYPDKAAWREDYNKCLAMIDNLPDYRGKLDNAKSVLAFIKDVKEGECIRLIRRLKMYSYLGNKLDLIDTEFEEMYSLSVGIEGKFDADTAYFGQELYTLPYEKRLEIYNDEQLSDYRYFLRELAEENPKVISEELQKSINEVDEEMVAARNEYNRILYTTEPDFPKFTMTDGTVIELDSDGLSRVYKNDPDNKWKAYYAYLEAVDKHREQYVPVFNRYMKAVYKKAQLYGFDSVKEYQAWCDGLPVDIYDKTIGNMGKNVPYDMKNFGVNTDYYQPDNYTYDEIMTDVRSAVSVLGNEYIENLNKIVTSSHIDVYSKENKIGTNFMEVFGNEYMPFINFTYGDGVQPTSVYSHEFGHAVHLILSQKNQNFTNFYPTVLVAEVASTTNEILYIEYMKNKAESDEEKIYYVSSLLNILENCISYGAIKSEFEDYCYKIIESGKDLEFNDMSDKFVELHIKYYGGTEDDFSGYRTSWAENYAYVEAAYYDYKYISDACYAVMIAEKVLSGEKGAAENYLKFLKAGKTANDVDLLKAVGVDPLADNTYQNLIDFYRKTTSEYKDLLAKVSDK